jgi:hypothetical protein
VESKAHLLVEFIQAVLLEQITQTQVDQVDHQDRELLNFTQVVAEEEHLLLVVMEFQPHRVDQVEQDF